MQYVAFYLTQLSKVAQATLKSPRDGASLNLEKGGASRQEATRPQLPSITIMDWQVKLDFSTSRKAAVL